MKLYENQLYLEDIKIIEKFNLDFSKLSNSNILITGGTGLIGTVVVDMLNYLNLKYQLNLSIYIISRNKSKASEIFSHINKTKIFFLEENLLNPLHFSFKIDYVIHAASNTHPILYASDPVGSMTTNIFGAFNLLNVAKENKGCRFILLSSVEIYGEDNLGYENGFSEQDIGYLDCNTVRANYSEGKRASESLCQAFKSQYDVDVVIIRLCRCYGPTLKKDDTKALSQFIQKALNKQDIVLKSEGKQYYSYIYSADAACSIIYLMLKGLTGEAYNVADSKSDITLKDLSEYIAKSAGTKVVFELPEQREASGYSKASRAILNSRKINELGWNALYSISDGINRTLAILSTL